MPRRGKPRLYRLGWSWTILLWALGTSPALWGQAGSGAAKLTLDTTTLPKGSPHQPYRVPLVAHGGTAPLRWEVVRGDLPQNMKIGDDGVLSGTPDAPGEWRFTIAVSDSSRPAQTVDRDFVLRVVAPLLLEWKNYAAVSGNRVAGSVAVSNSTAEDFDFTLIVLAVNETGKAFAIGYQRFPLKRDTDSFEIPFGETLPPGSYVVHVDAVGEVAARDAIYRARLQTREQLGVVAGP